MSDQVAWFNKRMSEGQTIIRGVIDLRVFSGMSSFEVYTKPLGDQAGFGRITYDYSDVALEVRSEFFPSTDKSLARLIDVFTEWRNYPGWSRQVDSVFLITDHRGQTREAYRTNVLVLQHLARIDGAIRVGVREDEDPLRAAFWHRLGGMITASNRELRSLFT